MLFTEETGATLDSVTFFVFGAILLGPEFKHLSRHSWGKSPPAMETKPPTNIDLDCSADPA